jgi:hypothetical protein
MIIGFEVNYTNCFMCSSPDFTSNVACTYFMLLFPYTVFKLHTFYNCCGFHVERVQSMTDECLRGMKQHVGVTLLDRQLPAGA